MSAAAQAVFDFGPILAAPDLTAYAKLFRIYIETQGGRIADQTRSQIARALGCDEKTVTRSSQELEDKGWMFGSNPGQGRPKAYLGANVLSKNGTVSFLERTNCPFSTETTVQQGQNVLSSDPPENAPVSAQTRFAPPAAAHGVGNGQGVQQGVYPARSNAPSTSTVVVFSTSNTENTTERTVEGSTDRKSQNLPVKEERNPRLPTLRELRTAFPAEIASIQKALHQSCPELAAFVPIGPDRGFDSADAQIYQEVCCAHSCEVGEVLRAIDDAFIMRGRQAQEAALTGRTLAPIRSWGYWRKSVLQNLGLERIPPKRETRTVRVAHKAQGATG